MAKATEIGSNAAQQLAADPVVLLGTDAVLDDLLDQLGDDTVIETIDAAGDDAAAGDEVLESVPDLLGETGNLAAGTGESLTDDLLDEIAGATAAHDARQEIYASQSGQLTVGDATPPTSNPDDVAASATTKKGKGKGKGKGKKAATSVPAGYGADADAGKPADAAGGAPDAETEPPAAKPVRATSVTHKPGDLLLAKMGAKAPDFLVFDLRHDAGEIERTRAAFLVRMNITRKDDEGYIADKVKDKISMLMNWLAKGGELNEVLKRSITLLHKDGQLTSGDKGNLHINLLAKPYSAGTARSQGNQMFMAFPELAMVVKEKGKMLPNEHSPILLACYAALGLK